MSRDLSIARRARSYPFPAYPNSWYAVAWSHEVAVGAVKAVRYLGQDLVVFRGQDKQIRVLDAVCPHLGAHLGEGGRVRGNELECPFHGWRFNGIGQCVAVPYAKSIPGKAQVPCWEVREDNGMVFVWYHGCGAPPSFEIPHMDGFGAAGWSTPSFHSLVVRTHVQEMNENIFDAAHFVYVHHFAALPTAEIAIDGPHVDVRLRGEAGLWWRAPSDTSNQMHGAGFTAIRARSQIALGPMVLPFEVLVVVGKTPIDDAHVEHRYAIAIRRTHPLLRLADAFVRRQVTADVTADARIWEHKVHLQKPLLASAEGAIVQFRKWHAQFYEAAS